MDTGSNPVEPTEPEPQLAPNPTEPTSEEPDSEIKEDKENLSPSKQSRKRRGKASAAPDFLPIKRARLEPGEERYEAIPGGCRAGAGDCLSALSLNRVIPAF